jgi:hypothetical protein
MIKFIKYNVSILATWFVYILLKKPIKIESIEFLEKHYNSTQREKKLIAKIKSINLKNR